MAIMRFHPFFTEISKKIKNGCFRTRKKGIEYGKNRIPRNPRTAAQRSVRATYGKAVQDWKQLTPEERQDYNERAKQLKISGWNLFLKEAFMVAWYEITIDNTANPNTLTDYQILLEIKNDKQFFLDADNRQETIRFYDEDKTTLLNHYTWSWDAATYDATLWIKVPSIPANSIKKIYLKLNKKITEDVSDPEATFDFWDDFNVFDTSKWGITANATVTIENGVAKIQATTNSDGIYTLQTFPPNRIVLMRLKWSVPLEDYHAQGFKESQVATGEFADYHLLELSCTPYYDLSFIAANKVTGALCSKSAPSISPNVDYELRIDYLSDRARFKIAGVTREITFIECIPTVNLPIRITPSSAQITRIDWILVRKGTYPEPTVSYTRL